MQQWATGLSSIEELIRTGLTRREGLEWIDEWWSTEDCIAHYYKWLAEARMKRDVTRLKT